MQQMCCKEKEIKTSDLSALTAYGNGDVAMFTKGQERGIIRENINHVGINKERILWTR